MGVDEAAFYDPTRVAILPMGFCYPGTGKSGDLPPRPECAPAWRARLLAGMPDVRLTLILGAHAMRWHLDTRERLTDVVRAWRDVWPLRLPLPHPSPRNNRWLTRNPWFEDEVLPRLRERVRRVLESGT